MPVSSHKVRVIVPNSLYVTLTANRNGLRNLDRNLSSVGKDVYEIGNC
jgi:hypothetical protein